MDVTYAKFHEHTECTTVPKLYSQVGLKIRRTDLDKHFPLPHKIKIPNLHIVRYTCQFEQYVSHRQNERRAHPSWAPTKEPTVSCWRYTPTPKTGPLPGPPGSYFSRLLGHNFIQIK